MASRRTWAGSGLRLGARARRSCRALGRRDARWHRGRGLALAAGAAVHPERRAALDPRGELDAPQSGLLCRHREIGGERRIVSLDRNPPPGFELEWDLGAVRIFSLEGPCACWPSRTASSRSCLAAPGRRRRRRGPPRVRGAGRLPDVRGAPARTPPRDRAAVDRLRPLGSAAAELEAARDGWLRRAVSGQPASAPPADHPFGLVGLTRAVDLDARRHRYAAGRGRGRVRGRAGGARGGAQPPAIPVWIDDGWLVTGEHVPAPRDHPPRRPASGRSRPGAGATSPSRCQRRGLSRGGRFESGLALTRGRPAPTRSRGAAGRLAPARAVPAHARSMLPTTL